MLTIAQSSSSGVKDNCPRSFLLGLLSSTFLLLSENWVGQYLYSKLSQT